MSDKGSRKLATILWHFSADSAKNYPVWEQGENPHTFSALKWCSSGRSIYPLPCFWCIPGIVLPVLFVLHIGWAAFYNKPLHQGEATDAFRAFQANQIFNPLETSTVVEYLGIVLR